jgi:hypothetical protein
VFDIAPYITCPSKRKEKRNLPVEKDSPVPKSPDMKH